MEFESHLELPSETLFHVALDMSLHGICIYGKAAILSLWACLPKVQAYHMPTHIKSLSRHNISDGSAAQEYSISEGRTIRTQIVLQVAINNLQATRTIKSKENTRWY